MIENRLQVRTKGYEGAVKRARESKMANKRVEGEAKRLEGELADLKAEIGELRRREGDAATILARLAPIPL